MLPRRYSIFDLHNVETRKSGGISCAKWFPEDAVPRYWIPLTLKGMVSLKLGLHRDIRSYIPDKLMRALLSLRGQFNNWVYRVQQK